MPRSSALLRVGKGTQQFHQVSQPHDCERVRVICAVRMEHEQRSPAIAKNAAILDWAQTPGGPMVELRKGTNGWTCLPDMPGTPGNDPMCMDKIAMQWAVAWMSMKVPHLTGMGIGYMLQGGATADNDDPSAKQPAAGKDWLWEPPHIMIFGAKIDPTVHSSEPNTTRPWVMFKGTPYEHLMVPVK